MPNDLSFDRSRATTGLVDVLDRVLDKGLLVAGDIRISLAEVELLTIRIRLIVCSIDKAQEIGMDWWRTDPHFAGGRERLSAENEDLRKQIRNLERRVGELSARGAKPARPRALRRGRRAPR
jgi:gas vesicle protein GvpA/GvpJ/GvpM family